MKPNKLSTLLPLGALAAGFSLAAAAQTAPAPKEAERELPTVKAKAGKEPQGKDGVQATHTEIGKGKQELRDIPQSITVVTEKLMDDRNLDTLKDVLRNTAGISFLAAEGGEEDIRLRGFPLQATGDVFVDGQRDPAFYERDTFFDDRVEVLRGSASMLFGRGSTGGAVNQVRKKPRLLDQHEVPSHRFNAAEKLLFWGGVLLLGLIVVVSGLVLDKVFPTLLAYTRGEMQIAHMAHAVAGVLMMAAFMGHIYIGTVGMKGALGAMRTGYVDEGWAREHHELWYDDIKAGKIPAKRSAETPPAPMSSAGLQG